MICSRVVWSYRLGHWKAAWTPTWQKVGANTTEKKENRLLVVHWHPLCLCNVRVLWWKISNRDLCVQKRCNCDLSDYLSWEVTGMGVVTKDMYQCWDIARQKGHCVKLERQVGKRGSQLEPVHPVSPPHVCLYKNKVSLASTAQSDISFSNKTKGNGCYFLLETCTWTCAVWTLC